MGREAEVWLKTGRLRLCPLTRADEAGVLEGLNDPEIACWLATTPYPYFPSDFHRYIEAAPTGETFAIHDDQGFAGLIGAGAELGYWVARRAQGRGYAREAAVALLAAVFEFYPGPVRAGYFVGNHASARVLDQLGFVSSGQGPKFCMALEQAMDHVDMILSRDQFRALHPLP